MPKIKKKYTLDDIISRYEARQLAIISAVLREIMKLFDGYADEAAFLYHQRKLINNRFLPPDVRKGIERISNTVNARAKDIIINGIKLSWILSDKKAKEIETLASGGRKPPTKRMSVIAAGPAPDRNNIYTSVNAYIKRKNNGINLSKRVWKLSNSYKKVLNDTMIEGLQNGESAAKLSRKIRANLREYKKGKPLPKGVYKSPIKNAERLTRSEINMAFANADQVRWGQQWFVLGYEVKLSNNHPVFDICDHMKGRYPKDFVFTKWHPQCRCYAVPVLASQEDRDKMMDFQLGLTDQKPSLTYIQSIPHSATRWMERNADRVNNWASKPYWLAQNESKIGHIFR